ncbi:gallate 1-beta-glucosyltransferase 84A24-like [Diospyros lotus]|uniref:gallate 1-beta-glucosyltransferase 84A24-like n=1 Tax=Diospyros lotus TaxID=55363 RepID=UPI0022599E83|nr:gallate 1-beta-glucosyltransferase 84A24-like [Diospyros lotus]
MGSDQALVHIFLVSFPGQGHVNPLLSLGKLLASGGLLITFCTTESFGREMRKATNIVDGVLTPVGDGFIRFEFFDDGLDDLKRLDLDQYLPQLEHFGKELIVRMLRKYAGENRPVSFLINNPYIPWVSDLAESLGLPSAMLWVQSCACFSACYHYFHGLVPFPSETQMEINVQLPSMPLLSHDEIPSFLHPSTPCPFLRRAILGQFKNLSKPFCVLMDSFQELENDNIEYMSRFCPIKPVGPLFKLTKQTNSMVTGDFLKADDCAAWLDSKPPSSVIYISFGSVVRLNQQQVNEIAHGLLALLSGDELEVSFLWVMRAPASEGFGSDKIDLPDGFWEKAGDKGKVVQWCPQEQVLAHPSTACFVSHCGWNSTMEAVASGVPVVAFPQWGDQVTDAKYLVDVFKVGIRLCRGKAENRVISREEVENCLRDVTVGPKAVEMKANALKWKKAAEEAVAEGGTSNRNFKAFLEEVRTGSALKASPTV